MLPSFLQRFMGSNNNSTSSGDDRRTMKTEPGSSIGDVNNNKSTEELMMDINSGIKQENTVGDTRSDDERIGQDEFTPLSRNDNDLYLEDYSSSRRGGTSRRTNNNTQSHRINNNNRAIEAATTVSPRRPVAAKLVRTPPKGSPTRKVSRFNNGRSVKSSDEPPIVHRVDGINGINNGGYQSHQHASHPLPPRHPSNHAHMHHQHQNYNQHHNHFYPQQYAVPYHHQQHTYIPNQPPPHMMTHNYPFTQQQSYPTSYPPPHPPPYPPSYPPSSHYSNTSIASQSINNKQQQESFPIPRRVYNKKNKKKPTAKHASSLQNNLPSNQSAPILTTKDLQDALPDCLLLTMDSFKLVECKLIPNGPSVGYRAPLIEAEKEFLYGTKGGSKGVVNSHIPLFNITKDKCLTERPDTKMKTSKIGQIQYETLCFVYCNKNKEVCPVEGKIIRVQHGKDMEERDEGDPDQTPKTIGIMYYERVDMSTQQPHKHQNHHLFPLEINPTSKQATKESLSEEQKLYIISCGHKGKVSKEDMENMVEDMIESEEIRCSAEQVNDQERFVQKVEQFIHNNKRSSKTHQHHFDKPKIEAQMTSEELRQVLELLSSNKDADTRRIKLDRSVTKQNKYLNKSEFKSLNKWIKVHEHDHDGSTWSYITFEYLHAKELAELAVTMFSDKLVQIEMDFVMGVCLGNEWQFGQLGFSDRNHKYWVLGIIIAKSENYTAAGRLLTHGTELIENAGGGVNCCLVDGGKALDKAIGIENMSRVGGGIADYEDEAILSLVDSMDTTAALALSEDDEDDFEELAEAFIGQENSDAGDAEGRKVLEEKLDALMTRKRMKKKRCHAHLTRKAGSRGGSWRGGKGSLCRQLLNDGCSNKEMKKILGVVFMISCIAPNDLETYANAMNLLIQQYEKNISAYVRKAYFNGNPYDLGGRCAGRAGDGGSTQGMESIGGKVKAAQKNVTRRYANPKQESKNPLRLMAGAARYASFHMKLDDPLSKFSAEPIRDAKFMTPILDEIRMLSDYEPPREPAASSRRKFKPNNLSMTWLYSICVVNEVEMPIEDVLGKHLSFELYIPTASRVLTSLSMMERKKMIDRSSAPRELKGTLTEKDLKNVDKLITILTELPVDRQKVLKRRLEEKRVANTPAVQEGEGPASYLYRRAHRDADSDAIDYKFVPKPSKKKKGKGKGKGKGKVSKSIDEAHEEQLERDKNADESIDEPALDSIDAVRSSAPAFSSEFEQIDGEGGAIEAAVADTIATEGDDGDVERETLKDRIKVKNELGDWTKVCVRPEGISCDCFRYNYYGDCPHCVYIDILHSEKYPKEGNMANEQWQVNRTRAIKTLRIERGRLR